MLKRLNTDEDLSNMPSDLVYSTSISKHASMIATKAGPEFGSSVVDARDNPAKLSWLSNKSAAER